MMRAARTHGLGRTHGPAHTRATRRPPGIGSSLAVPSAGNSRRACGLFTNLL